MKLSSCSIYLFALASFAPAASAQLNPPNPTPATSPRANWVRLTNTNNVPTQRRDNPGAASLDKLYLFGGRLGNSTSTALNALYEFDGTTWTLKTAEGANGSPPVRGGACVAWDFSSKKLVVFGGDSGGATPALLGDTWEWDPTTNAWTQIMGTGPAARRWSAMTYDPLRRGLILFGGETVLNGAPVNDTWFYSNGTWTQLATPTPPPGRRLHSLVTRTSYRDILLVAGQDAFQTPQIRFLDVWRWTGGTWIQVNTGGTHPHGTTANQAVYDEARERVVLQGGQGISVPNTAGGGQYGDLYGGSPSTWCSEFDSLTNRWILYGQSAFNTADPAIGRVSRYYAGYVPALGKVYRASGQDPSGVSGYLYTAEYQATPIAAAAVLGTGCQNLALAGLAPEARPWLGRTLTTQATGLKTGAISLGLLGFQSFNIPLSAVFSFGGVGCTLYSGFDLVVVLPNGQGAANFALPLPNDVTLAGATFYEQVIEFTVSGSTFTGAASSNALTMTVGVL